MHTITRSRVQFVKRPQVFVPLLRILQTFSVLVLFDLSPHFAWTNRFVTLLQFRLLGNFFEMAKNEQVAIQLINLWIYLLFSLCISTVAAVVDSCFRSHSHFKWKMGNNLFHRNNICLVGLCFFFFFTNVSLLFDWCFYADQTQTFTEGEQQIEQMNEPKGVHHHRQRASVLFVSTVQESIFYFKLFLFLCSFSFFLLLLFLALVRAVSPIAIDISDKHWNKWHRFGFLAFI